MAEASTRVEEVSFPTQDGGLVYADLYGAGHRGVVLAHGARFNKASWKEQAARLVSEGFFVAALEFRGYGKSRGGPESKSQGDALHFDVLAAAQYLRHHGATTVAVIGGSMGGGAAANAIVNGPAGSIDRLVLLAHAPVQSPERITGPKLFITAQGDPIAPRVRDQYEKAPAPKELVILGGSAHAQFLFATEEAELLMQAILRFLAGRPAAE